MLEQRKRLFTPTKLEYNLEAQTTTFDVVEEVEKILQMISSEDLNPRCGKKNFSGPRIIVYRKAIFSEVHLK